MFRILIAAAAAVFSVCPLFAAAPQPADGVSTVFFARDEHAISDFEENAERSRALINSLITAITGQAEPGRAWRTLVSPEDRVGIKVATAGGRYFSTHRGVVEAIVAGLQAAGVARERIIVWDRSTDDLRAAGFLPATGRYQVRAIDPPRGYDREAQISYKGQYG